MEREGIKFPVALDNNYGTWNAYANNYWPHKYLIDTDGYIVYDHIGEGKYEETEQKIQEALAEKMRREKTGATLSNVGIVHPTDTVTSINTRSPEIYFGANRNEYSGNGMANKTGKQIFQAPSNKNLNTPLLEGSWNIQSEYAESTNAIANIHYRYAAERVYFVASAKQKK